MMTDENCVFCKIVAQTIPSYPVYEDTEHLAFLSIFPNTEGVTVVIPKEHHTSYFADIPEEVVLKLFLTARKVAKLLDQNLDDVGRTAMVFEGFGVNHLHIKLFPMHGTKDMSEWKPIHSEVKIYFEKYPGYISTHDGEQADKEVLKTTAKKIRK